MSLLTQAQAAFVLQQIEETQTAKLNVDRLTWRFRVGRGDIRPSWIHVEWDNLLTNLHTGRIVIAQMDSGLPSEQHMSPTDMKTAYGF
jgi:hypothetical protein